MKNAVKRDQRAYLAPEFTVHEVCIEKGFALSDGSTIEDLCGYLPEEKWN